MVANRAALRRWGRYAEVVTRWEQITGRAAPSPSLSSDETDPRPAPEFVEWLMGLPLGWVTSERNRLSVNQQLTALGNGVLPRQAVAAIITLLRLSDIYHHGSNDAS